MTNKSESAANAIFEEIGVVYDAENLYHQTMGQILAAAEIIGMRHP